MKPNRKNLKVICIDLDGVLSEGENWGGQKTKPIQKNIDLVNKLYLKHFVVIWTARRYALAEETLEWLMRSGVHYHAIRFEKIPSDVYVDDKFVSLEALKKYL